MLAAHRIRHSRVVEASGFIKTVWNLEEVGIRGLGPDKAPTDPSRYEELRNWSGVVLKLGISSVKRHHSRITNLHIKKDIDVWCCRDPTLNADLLENPDASSGAGLVHSAVTGGGSPLRHTPTNPLYGVLFTVGFWVSICGRFSRDDTYSKALGETDPSVSVSEGDSGVRVD